VALLSGFDVRIDRASDAVERLIVVALPKPPPPPPPQPRPEHKAKHQASAAPKARPAPPGGSPGPKPVHLPPPVVPVVAVKPAPAPSGGGAGSGPAAGNGSGGGSGGTGYGDSGEGGTDLVQIAGAISPSDYPRSLGNAGIGGRVSVTFTVETNGRVSGCRVTRSSGIPELDALTCRLMEERFRFRPSTDRYGRPIRDEVDWDHDWSAPRH
jgi:protein TonB